MNQYKTEGYEKEELDREDYKAIEETRQQEKEKPKKLTFEETWGAVPVSGGIFSSPAIIDDIICFGSCDRHLYALAKNGKMLWKFVTGDVILSSPTIYNDIIYFGSGDGHLYALNADGKLKWKFLTGNRVISSPVIIKDRIYFGSGDGYLYCLSLDGKLIWKFLTGGAIINTPTTANDKIYFGSWDKHFYALDLDGRLAWKFLTDGSISGAGAPTIADENFNVVSEFHNRIYEKSPTIKSGIVFSGCQDNNLYALSIDGRLIWKFLTGGTVSTRTTVSKRRVYFGSWDSYFYCLSSGNGKELWRFKAGGPFSCVPVVHKNKVYVCSHDYSLYVFDEYGKLFWQFRTGGNMEANPVIADDTIYFGSLDSYFYAIDIENRTVKWTFSTGLGTQADKISEIVNAVIEFDRKIFKVWKPETTGFKTKGIKETYKLPEALPSDFTFAGENAYTSSSPYLLDRKKEKKERKSGYRK